MLALGYFCSFVLGGIFADSLGFFYYLIMSSWIKSFTSSFLFICSIAMARTSSTLLKNNGENSILVLFLTLEENFQSFHHWVWCFLWVLQRCSLSCWGSSLMFLIFWVSWKVVGFCWMVFLSTEMIVWLFSPFTLWMWFITLIDFSYVEPPFHSWVKSHLVSSFLFLWCICAAFVSE